MKNRMKMKDAIKLMGLARESGFQETVIQLGASKVYAYAKTTNNVNTLINISVSQPAIGSGKKSTVSVETGVATPTQADHRFTRGARAAWAAVIGGAA